MTTENGAALEFGDIQVGTLMLRPNPYAGTYLALRIDGRHAGRELLQRLIPLLDPVAEFDPARLVSLAVALSFADLAALRVPEEWLATFPPEFRDGMAARAAEKDDPELGTDPERSNAFLYGDDPRGLKCPEGAPAETDPLISGFDDRQCTIPQRPIRRRLQGRPSFVVNRGGEHWFMPGLRALRWLADFDT